MNTSNTPARWQLKRAKGWRKPPGVLVVSRPTKWGNPFNWADFTNATTPAEKRREAVKAFEAWLNGDFGTLYQDEREEILESLPELIGKDLACWCPENEPCHADVLIRLAIEAAKKAVDEEQK